MNMVSFKNKLQSSENLVGLNTKKTPGELDELFAELFALVNLESDNNTENNPQKLVSDTSKTLELKGINNKTISENKTIDLTKSLAEVFYKELGISELKVTNNSDFSEKIINNPNLSEKINKLLLNNSKNTFTTLGKNQNFKKLTTNTEGLDNVKKTFSANKINSEEMITSKISETSEPPKNQNLVIKVKKIENWDSHKSFQNSEIKSPLKENNSYTKTFNNNINAPSVKGQKYNLAELKEKKILKKNNFEVNTKNFEDVNISKEANHREINHKIFHNIQKTSDRRSPEINSNHKNLIDNKLKFSEKNSKNTQNFMNEQTLDLLESSWGEKFSKLIKNSIDNGIKKVDIYLKPKNLGKLNVEVFVKDKQTHININAESQEVANLLNENLTKISDIIEEKNNKFSLFNDNNNNGSLNQQNQPKKDENQSSLILKKRIDETKIKKDNNRNIDVNA